MTLTNSLLLEILCFFYIQNTIVSIFFLLFSLLFSFSFTFLKIFIVARNRGSLSVIEVQRVRYALNIWEAIREVGNHGNLRAANVGIPDLMDTNTEMSRTFEMGVSRSSF